MARQRQNGRRGGNGEPANSAKAVPAAQLRLVVGIGASAGGLDAFRAFLANTPPQSGMAFVLVQHLDPHHRSLLVELLSSYTAMPVAHAEDGMAVAADHVFVIPPNATLTIEAGILRITTPAPAREHRKPIDTFFAALAEDQGEKAVAIILSGSGSDGSLGLRAVKEQGGFTLAQAGFDETALLGMPSSAAATGLVDEIMPVEQMPARLLAYAGHLNEMDGRKVSDGTRRDVAEHLTRICALLRARLGHDFSGYKPSTVTRRIQRRMQVLQIDSVPEYIDRLRQEPGQLDLLFRDLLIGITQFFRDPEAFAALAREALPKLLANRRSEDQIRLWVPGCATGEEAYSIAMLVREAMIALEVAPKVQIFASDLDGGAVAIARRGRYRKPLSGVSPERLQRWFLEEDDNYCVTNDIREMCIFSVHNLINDLPFARLDLISCRNLLIYLNTTLQNRIVRTFHYALRPGGWLFLGAAEGVSRHDRLFAIVDKKYRVFQRRDDVAASLPMVAPADLGGAHRAAAQPVRGSEDGIERRIRYALEKYSPAYLVIDQHHEIVRFSARTGPYLEPSSGAASLNLFSILRGDLQPTVRSAVQQAFATTQTVIHEDLVVAVNGSSRIVNLIVEPIAAEAEAALCVVAFQERGFIDRTTAPAGTGEAADIRIDALEKELRATRTQLQGTIDDFETANEELKSANEEYQSVNEEFQSTNEELESSKEELQSMNEELHTINSELNAKNEGLEEANSDLKNLLDSTQIATLFLDGELRIRNFTPALAEIFHVRASDRGRPVTEIATRLDYPDLQRDVENVLRSLAMIEREVSVAQGGASFLMRIRPYRTVSNAITGVVITFVDVSERKRHEEDRARLAAIIDSSDDAIIGKGPNDIIVSWNRAAERLFGYPAEEVVGQPITILYPPDRLDEAAENHARIWRGERIAHHETVHRRKDGSPVAVSLTESPVKDAEGRVIGSSKIAQDVTERRRADDLRALLVNELNHRVKNTLATVQSIAVQSLKGALDGQSREILDARLIALARAHDLLSRDSWQGAGLRDLLLLELEPYQSEERTRFVLEGPDVGLPPKAALALGMAFHELATNAAKYGALSRPAGQVRVNWDVSKSAGAATLRLKWAENGGPPVEKTGHKGFGSILIERGLAHELDAEVALDFAPGGLVCALEIPLAAGGVMDA